MWIEPHDEFDVEVDGTGYHVDEFYEDGFTSFVVETKSGIGRFAIVEISEGWEVRPVIDPIKTFDTITEAWKYVRGSL